MFGPVTKTPHVSGLSAWTKSPEECDNTDNPAANIIRQITAQTWLIVVAYKEGNMKEIPRILIKRQVADDNL